MRGDICGNSVGLAHASLIYGKAHIRTGAVRTMPRTLIFEERYGVSIDDFEDILQIDQFIEEKLGRPLKITDRRTSFTMRGGSVLKIRGIDRERWKPISTDRSKMSKRRWQGWTLKNGGILIPEGRAGDVFRERGMHACSPPPAALIPPPVCSHLPHGAEPFQFRISAAERAQGARRPQR